MNQQEVNIVCGKVTVKGILSISKNVKALIIFAHGSGSGRLSPRNTFVANELNKNKLATLLIYLLTPQEEADRSNVFDINLLSERLMCVTDWAMQNNEIKALTIGYFGASTGAAAALEAVSKLRQIYAVVSRGGRPDLAMPYLSNVKAPTLLIVGGNDEAVIPLNETALEKLNKDSKLLIVDGATHLFEESGKLQEVARLSSDWFLKHLE